FGPRKTRKARSGPVSFSRGARWAARRFASSVIQIPRSLLNEPNRPEVAGEASLSEIGVGKSEISAHAPASAPGVSDDEPLLRIVVADRHHRVAAKDLLARCGHRGDAGLRDFL